MKKNQYWMWFHCTLVSIILDLKKIKQLFLLVALSLHTRALFSHLPLCSYSVNWVIFLFYYLRTPESVNHCVWFFFLPNRKWFNSLFLQTYYLFVFLSRSLFLILWNLNYVYVEPVGTIPDFCIVVPFWKSYFVLN